MKNKYWHLSYVQKRNGTENTLDGALNDCHPFEEIARLNKEDEYHGYVLTFFRGISKEEYDMFLKCTEE